MAEGRKVALKRMLTVLRNLKKIEQSIYYTNQFSPNVRTFHGMKG